MIECTVTGAKDIQLIYHKVDLNEAPCFLLFKASPKEIHKLKKEIASYFVHWHGMY